MNRHSIMFAAVVAVVFMALQVAQIYSQTHAGEKAEVNTEHIGRYRLAVAESGIYKMDTVTGKVWRSAITITFTGVRTGKFEEVK